MVNQADIASTTLITSSDNLENLNSEDTQQDGLFLIVPHIIEEEEGYSFRSFDSEEVKANIESLAKQWATDASAIPPLVVALKDGRVYVRDGYCRLRAANIAIENGLDLKSIPCELEQKYIPKLRPR